VANELLYWTQKDTRNFYTSEASAGQFIVLHREMRMDDIEVF